jgi:long-chain acyl-CoA synthetase
MVSSATAELPSSAPATLCDVAAGLAAHGTRTALIDFRDGRPVELSYAAIGERIVDTALRLHAAGIGRGSCVAIWAPNSASWVIGYFGAVRAGATVVPIDQQSMPTTAAEILEHAGAALLLTTDAHRAELRELGRGCETLPIEGRWGTDPGDGWPAPSADASELPTIEPDDVAALLYTSGTTGVPKAVPLTHRNLTTNAVALTTQQLLGAHDRVLLPLPLHHTYPFTVGLVTALLKRAAVVFPAGISGPEITGAARAAEATALLAVPRLCEALWESVSSAVEQRGERAKKLFYRMLRLSIAVRRTTGARIGKRLFKPVHEKLGQALDLIGCGGAKLDPELAWRLEGLGWTVLTGYGLTETSPVLTFNDRAHSRIGSEGRPLPGVELAIRPVPGETDANAPRPARDHVEGEIVARGPTVFSGYRGNPQATADAFTSDGFFRTGDLGWLDRKGYLRVVGRSKELLVLADGKKVFPEALEKQYASSSLLTEVAILEDRGRLVALIVPDERAIRERGTIRQAALLREDLEEIGARLPPYQRITAFRVARSPLPRTQLGKLRRHLLPELYKRAAAADAAPASSEPTAEDTKLLASERGRAAWQWLVARYPDKQVTLDTSPQLELQIDSLEWVALTTEIEQRFRVSLTGEAVSRILTVRDLIQEIATAELMPTGAPSAATAATAAAAEVRLPGFAMRCVGAAIFALVRPLMRLLFGIKVAGLENVAGDEALVIAPNHASYLDPLALAAALPWRRLRRTYWAGWVGVLYTGPITRFVSRATQVMPVDPDRDLASAIGTARALMQRGYSIVWFAEGRRSPTGEVGPFFGGIGQLVLDTGARALPTAIRGTFEALPKQRRWPRLNTPLSVQFGAPLALREPRGSPRAALNVSGRLEREVRALFTGTPVEPLLGRGGTDTTTRKENSMSANEWTETLKDGRRVAIRAIRIDDIERNERFLEALSPPSKHFLFLGGIARLSDDALRRLCDPDQANDVAFVALEADAMPGSVPRQVGVSRYAGASSPQGAEISVAVADDWQHRGLGRRLLAHLIDYARAHGVKRLYSMDSMGNNRMRKLAQSVGFSEKPDPDDASQVICYLDLAGGAGTPRAPK